MIAVSVLTRVALLLCVCFILYFYFLVSKYSSLSYASWIPSSFSLFALLQQEGNSYVRRVTLNHPIPTLMDNAEKEYKAKLARQSKTLKQAVAEYKRRYHRLPPQGFDEWFEFARENEFKMMDEWDSLVADLEPFWVLPPEELRRRTEQVATLPGIDTVRVRHGNATAVTHQKKNAAGRPPSERASHFIMMAEKFLHKLPDMDFSLSTKSESRVMVPWEHLNHPNTTILDSSEGINWVLGGPFVEDWRGEGSIWDSFRRSCPPNSPARRLFSAMRGTYQTHQSLNLLQTPISAKTSSGGKSGNAHFRMDSSLVGVRKGDTEEEDFCEKPYGRYLQGHFFSDYRTIHELYPIFSPAKAPGYNDIVIPSHYYYGETKRYTYGRDPVNMITKEVDNFEVDWEGKKNQIFWRGATTGGGSSPPGHLHKYQRHRLVQIAGTQSRENTTVVFPESSTSPRTTSYIQATLPASSLNAEMFDVAFTTPIGCALYKSGGCEQMKNELRFADAVQLTDHWNYKYLVDVDGMGYSAHFLAFMASESAVLKSSVYQEFFSDWVQPWLHYIPVSQTYNDLYNIYAYFSGPTSSVVDVVKGTYQNFTAPMPPPDGTAESGARSAARGAHEGDRRLRRIARAGRHWKKTTTRRIDQEIYVYRLCLEWARLWSDDRESMVYYG